MAVWNGLKMMLDHPSRQGAFHIDGQMVPTDILRGPEAFLGWLHLPQNAQTVTQQARLEALRRFGIS